ncbi:MAG: PEGA domain-containing protein [Candidatus Micrarchaeota archaeon]
MGMKKAVVLVMALVLLVSGANDTPVAPQVNATMGHLDISSIPAGADISYLRDGNGTRAGKTPANIEIDEGYVEIVLKKQGYKEYRKLIYIYGGMTQDVVAELEMMPSPTPIVSLPAPTPVDYSCNYTSMRDRVKCRLMLTDEEKARGLPPIPEECRIKEGIEFGECVSNYAKLKICLSMGTDSEREMCARGYLGLKEKAADGKADCNRFGESERTGCASELRKRTHALIVFRLNVLGEKAEKLVKFGVNMDRAGEFIYNLELKKLEFGQARNLERRKQVIWEVKKLWGDFKRDAVAQLMEKKV